MSRKKLHIEGITNELEGASLFFTSSSPTSTSQIQPVLVSESNQETKPRPNPNPNNTKEAFPLSENVSDLVSTNHAQEQPTNQLSRNEEIHIKTTNERTSERTNERYIKRRKIRHTFDIYADQLLSLREISIEEEKYTGERVLLGDLAQQALDMFISKQRNK